MLYCSGCNSVYTGTDRPLTCPVCKTMLVEKEVREMLYCPKCGREGQGQNSFCTQCGVRLVAQQVSHSSGSAVGLWGSGILLMIFGMIGLILAGPKMGFINSGWGMAASGLSDGVATEFHMWQTLFYGSIAAMAVGGVLFQAGVLGQVIQKR